MRFILSVPVVLVSVWLPISCWAQLAAPVNFNLPSNSSLAQISTVEHYIDQDPGLGNAHPISVSSGNDVSTGAVSVRIDTLAPGVHHLCARVKNANGSWGITNNDLFYIVPAGTQIPANHSADPVANVEYFIDQDPGLGKAHPISVSSGNDVSTGAFSVRIDTLAPGVHHLYARVKNANGSWGITNNDLFYIVPAGTQIPANPGTANVSAVECFFDTDPGLGKGIPITISSGADVAASSFVYRIDTLPEGIHQFYVRSMNADGAWSIITVQHVFIIPPISLPATPPVGNMTKLEYSFDSDSGFNQGKAVSFSPTMGLSGFSFSANIGTLQHDTTHTIYLRVFDGWSQTVSTTFSLIHPLALNFLDFSAELKDRNKVLLHWTTKSGDKHFFHVQRSVDGQSFKNLASIPGLDRALANNKYQFLDINPPKGKVFYRIKDLDQGNLATYSRVLSLVVPEDGSGFFIVQESGNTAIQIHFEQQPGPGQFEIFNMEGQLLQTIQSSGTSVQQIDILDLASGSYLLQYHDAKIQTTKLFTRK